MLTSRCSRWVMAGLTILCVSMACTTRGSQGTLPNALTDPEFWELSHRLSEPPGTFSISDNLVSNEEQLSRLVGVLDPRPGVYFGVGPEQNFSYIARVRPAMAFIVDLRRENHSLHLLYKALFELSTDRADLVSRLFSRARPAGLDASVTVTSMFNAFSAAAPSMPLYQQTRQAVEHTLRERRSLPITQTEVDWIANALAVFRDQGPDLHYYGRSPASTADAPSYRELMTAGDLFGNPRSYLASDEAFQFVKALHARNLIVPVVGNFAGAHALSEIARFLTAHDARLAAFYGSNVTVYLSKEQTTQYCRNLAAMPVDAGTWFIDSRAIRPYRVMLERCGAATPSAGAP